MAMRYPSRLRIQKSRKTTATRKYLSFHSLTRRLTETDFKLVYRMRREDFYELMENCRGQFSPQVDMESYKGNVPPELRLAVTIRLLGGSRVGDVMSCFNVGRSTAYAIFHEGIAVLDGVLHLPLLPKTHEGLGKLAKGFKCLRATPNPLTGCVGALDGICIKIIKPPASFNPALFYCRKGYYAIPVQALVYFMGRFLCAAANSVGSAHDSLAHFCSKLGQYLEKSLLSTEV